MQRNASKAESGKGKMKTTAIVLAAGKGSRMKSDTPKQFLELLEKPIVYYSLKTFEMSNIDEIVIVTLNGMEEYIFEEIVKKYSIGKVKDIVSGASARYLSVYNGMKRLKDTDYVLIHDSARPFITVEKINEIIENVQKNKAVIPGISVKDTIKQISSLGVVENTPARNSLVAVQTPQAFDFKVLLSAYEKIDDSFVDETITDDSCVWERYVKEAVYVIAGEETNIKITTPGDISVGEEILKSLEHYPDDGKY